MSRDAVAKLAVPLATGLAGWQVYRRHRRRQLALMPKGINAAHGITMRSTIKAARPTAR
ncbi:MULTISPECIES: hypothetical protein [Mycobacterium]|uniref:Uncharacterized protein n=1 Tax=Mycobacterium kiyosense TaxID=2871094 RepID=A0A9P3Q4K2_9MYCO|nr:MULTISPECIES: hypothetical protein [Mycobacterium]BDB43995.1 hypothetical protein IWGMT90018_44410 [Mycobacterium kiyosense]BDE15539.1 hypothetical protein MKCMC460_43990 [Mycobacterium sp. 20KCMC460]GLB81037.1 hypothetical protein SRL2020028_02930 [Mycobacterium kiyosense]GLB87202.1 hypothetical protein SRL2020130_00190 [Mycobacterium kiyosense]GLB93518.1 hypothetical protein SRL2020226_02940 [Mycobacterium kiyosense]